MQAYGHLFAKVYDREWGDYANRIAPEIHEFYESNYSGRNRKSLLDLCCGTGQLSAYFLDHDYRVIGLDLSEDMLAYAREKTLTYIIAGKAKFLPWNAANFELNEMFGLVVSTYDALNHLPDLDSLTGCFRSTIKVLEDGGYFIFDLNTAFGLKKWNSLSVTPGEDVFLLNRGLFDEKTVVAWTKITGFVQNEDGLYERFDETVYNTVFELSAVKESLLGVGFESVYFAQGTDLSSPVHEPEKAVKVFVIAKK
jgi:SAM-dependent methyltransferase